MIVVNILLVEFLDVRPVDLIYLVIEGGGKLSPPRQNYPHPHTLHPVSSLIDVVFVLVTRLAFVVGSSVRILVCTDLLLKIVVTELLLYSQIPFLILLEARKRIHYAVRHRLESVYCMIVL